MSTLLALFICSALTFGQDTTKLAKKTINTNMEMQKDTVFYTCTMHPDVKLLSPGKCPKCGMDLVKKQAKADASVTKSEGVITYTCTMHPEITASIPGKCPKCGMEMVVKK